MKNSTLLVKEMETKLRAWGRVLDGVRILKESSYDVMWKAVGRIRREAISRTKVSIDLPAKLFS